MRALRPLRKDPRRPRLPIAGAIAAAAVPALAGCAAPSPTPHPGSDAGPPILIEDVYRFFEVYDAAHGRPTAEALERDYLAPGSASLRAFARLRGVTAERIAANLAAHPEAYAEARRCMEVLPGVRRRLEAALAELTRIHPKASLPPVAIVVGRGKPVAIGSPEHGAIIGLEALCAVEYLNPDVEDRFVHVIAHEYAHVQQPRADEDAPPTLLEGALREGAAELIAELTSGAVAYAYFESMTKGREAEIERAFVADLDSAGIAEWLYNGTLTEPGDLGYWVGYRIAKAYYRNAADGHRAIRELLELAEPRALLAASGWYPGIDLR